MSSLLGLLQSSGTLCWLITLRGVCRRGWQMWTSHWFSWQRHFCLCLQCSCLMLFEDSKSRFSRTRSISKTGRSWTCRSTLSQAIFWQRLFFRSWLTMHGRRRSHSLNVLSWLFPSLESCLCWLFASAKSRWFIYLKCFQGQSNSTQRPQW